MSPDANGKAAGITVVNRAMVRCEPAAIFKLLADLEREPEWNDKLLEVGRITGWPLEAGSRYRARFPWPVGESIITYDQVDAPAEWQTHSTARWLDVELVGRIAGTGDGSEVVLSTTLHPKGPLTLLRRMIARTMQSSWDTHLDTIRRTIESASPPDLSNPQL
jgi:hypothetical protein